MNTIRPNEQRANIAILMIWIVLAMEIVSLISNYFQLELLNHTLEGNPLPMEEINANDTRVQLIGVLYLIVYIISGITFIMWFSRAYFNLHNRLDELEYSDGWAAGSWFVPIIGLFRPYKIMKEIYEENLTILYRKDIDTNISTQFLGWWWFLWIASGVLGQISFRLTLHADDLNKLVTSTTVEIASNIIAIPLAIIAVKVVKDASTLETEVDLAPDEKVVEVISQPEISEEANTKATENQD